MRQQDDAFHVAPALSMDYARTMNCVVRLKGGDPSIFGRLDEEMQALRAAGVASEVVPGITAASAAAAELQASLTLRAVARSVTFLTPCVCDEHDDATWLPAAASVRAGASLVVYMAGRQIVATAQRLIASGCAAATPIAVLESVSSADARQWVGTLAEAATSAPAIAGGPVVLLIGKALRQRARPRDIESSGRAGRLAVIQRNLRELASGAARPHQPTNPHAFCVRA